MEKLSDKLYSWASLLDEATAAQALMSSRTPIIWPHLALMPDAHLGIGATVGSVVPTRGGIIPSTVGVDWGCFTGDTEVVLADSKRYTLKELAERSERFVVYSATLSGRIIASWATAALTRRDAPLVRVTLDTGESVRCTPDHQFMLRSGEYVEARDLRPGDSLMPFYSQKDEEGYFRVRQPYSGHYQRAHWIVARSGLLGDIPKIADQRIIVHHRNFDESDNTPENLVFMGNGDHSRYHRSLVERNTHWRSTEFEEHRVEGLRAKAETDEGMAYYVGKFQRYHEEHHDKWLQTVAENGKRGAPYLTKYNTSDEGRRRSSEVSSRLLSCPFCDATVKSYVSMSSHLRTRHNHTGPFADLLKNNHQIAAVEALIETEDVYCLTVPEHHNFALAIGVFVHNCGMEAARLDLRADALPGLTPFLRELERSIPTGPGGSRQKPHPLAVAFMDACPVTLTERQRETALHQCGSLGSGNHFVEIVQDENGDVWLFLHSGSRGIGNQLATAHINKARQMHKAGLVDAEHADLAWFSEGTPEFEQFIPEMMWGQEYALMNRRVMMAEALDQFRRFLARTSGAAYDPDGSPDVLEHISCHHNYAQQEEHFGERLWVTRKGAISARAGELGLIPGSMGAASYVVRGRGNPLSLHSSPHGAGRLLSRNAARRAISAETLAEQMGTRVWNRDKAGKLTDEAPDAYKPIDTVMADAADLVEVVHTFRQLLNFKG